MNEISGRYSVMADEFFVPTEDEICPQSKSNKQGRSTDSLHSSVKNDFAKTLQADQTALYKRYEKYIESDIARELARVNLPLSLYTQFYWQIDLHNLFHFLKLRLDSHAQKEIRDYGVALASCAKAVAPLAYDAFERHIREGIQLSAHDVNALKKMLRDATPSAATLDKDLLKKLGVQ